ncbi:MAG: hypothetical protein ACR2J8_12030, partial [Thermomicrobiales bacterium]
MTSLDARARPWQWWGPFDSPSDPPGIARLVSSGALSRNLAAFLGAAVHAGASLAVCAIPSGAGKTTLLTALVDALPTEVIRYYPRGHYEDFASLDALPITSADLTFLINEISHHLPIYLWGKQAARVLRLGVEGCQLLATAHADSATTFSELLADSSFDIGSGAIAAFDLVVALGESQTVQRVEAIFRQDGHLTAVAIPLDPDPANLRDLLHAAAVAGSPLARIRPDFLERWAEWAQQDRPSAPDP